MNAYFKTKVPAKATITISITIDIPTVTRIEELVVKSPDEFSLHGLSIGPKQIFNSYLPAVMFAEDAVTKAFGPVVISPQLGASATLVVENESDEEREFVAILKGRTS